MRRSPLVASPGSFDTQLPPLVRGTLAGDPRAWQGLWLVLDPFVDTIASRWRYAGPLAHRIDDRRNVVTAFMGRIHADDFRRLRGLQEVLPEGPEPARAWIATVTIHVTLNYAEGHEENLGAELPGGPPRWAAVVPLPDDVEEHLPVSVRAAQHAEAHRILAYAEQHLEPLHLEALHRWIRGYEPADIARALDLDDDAAQRLVRGAVMRLRRACGDDAKDGPEENRPVAVTDRPRRLSRKR